MSPPEHSELWIRRSLAVEQFKAVLTTEHYRPDRVGELVEIGVGYCLTALSLAESPIERAMVPWLVFGNFPTFGTHPVPVFDPSWTAAPPASYLHIVPQLVIGRYRLDFAIIAKRANRSIILALECDGHDFHDPRADLQRDACLATYGVATIRASGSEIHQGEIYVVERVASFLQAWGA